MLNPSFLLRITRPLLLTTTLLCQGSFLTASPLLTSFDDQKQHAYQAQQRIALLIDRHPQTLIVTFHNDPTKEHDGNLPALGSYASTPEFLTTLFGDFVLQMTQFHLSQRLKLRFESPTHSSDSDTDSDSDATESIGAASVEVPGAQPSEPAEDSFFSLSGSNFAISCDATESQQFPSFESIQSDFMPSCPPLSHADAAPPPSVASSASGACAVSANSSEHSTQTEPLTNAEEQLPTGKMLPLVHLSLLAFREGFHFQKHYASMPDRGVLTIGLYIDPEIAPSTHWMMYPHPSLTLPSIAEQVLRTLLIKTQNQLRGTFGGGLYS